MLFTYESAIWDRNMFTQTIHILLLFQFSTTNKQMHYVTNQFVIPVSYHREQQGEIWLILHRYMLIGAFNGGSSITIY